MSTNNNLNGIRFYNPKLSALGLNISTRALKGQFILAKSINPNIKKPHPGDKIFDWENKVVFSIDHIEAVQLLRFVNVIQSILRSKEKDPNYNIMMEELDKYSSNQIKTKDLRYKKELTHAPTGNMRDKWTKLTIVPNIRGSKQNPKLGFNIMYSDSERKYIMAVLNQDQAEIFKYWLGLVSKIEILVMQARLFLSIQRQVEETFSRQHNNKASSPTPITQPSMFGDNPPY